MQAKHAKGGEARRRPVLAALCAVVLAMGLMLPCAAFGGEDAPADDTAFEAVVEDVGSDEAGALEDGDAQDGDDAEEVGADDVVTDGATDVDGQDNEEADGAGDPQDVTDGESADAEPDDAGDADTDAAAPGDAEAAAAQADGDTDAAEPSAEPQADEGASAQADEVTVTFYGPNKIEKTVPAGTTLTAADLPEAPATTSFELWCAPVKGTFAGWYVGTFNENNQPQLAYKDYSGEVYYGASYGVWKGDGTMLQKDASRLVSAVGLSADANLQILPVYVADLEYLTFEVSREYEEGKFGSWTYSDWTIPAGYVLTEADVKVLGESFANNSYQNYALFEDGRKFLGFFSSEDTNDPLSVADLTQKCLGGDDNWMYALYGWGPEWMPPVIDEEEGSVSLTVTGNLGIKASGNLKGENIPEGAEIEVATSVLTSGAAYDDLDELLGSSRIGDIYEVTLLVNGKEVHDKFGTLTISKPIDPKYNGHVIITYHRHADGSITTSRSVAKDGYVTYTVTDLSAFAMVDGGLPPEDEGEDDEPDNGKPAAAIPDTGSDKKSADSDASLAQAGDASPAAPLAAVALAALALAAAALRRSRRAAGCTR